VPRDLSPEAREKLARLAKERHAEGRFGGKEFGKMGGRPRGGSKKKQRITKAVAEAAEEDKNKNAIIQVFKDAIHPNQPMSIRLKGAEAWAAIAKDHAKMELAEEAHAEIAHSREELIALLAGKLSDGPVAAIVRGQIEQETGIIDAEVIEEESPQNGDRRAA
jgi:hypothetical protein